MTVKGSKTPSNLNRSSLPRVLRECLLCLPIILTSAVVKAQAGSFNDDWPPKLDQYLPGFSLQGDHYDWLNKRWEFLAESEVPWIHLYAQLRVLSDKYGYDHQLYEEEYWQKQREIEAILEHAPTDLFSQAVVAQTCQRQLCDRLGVFERIMQLDPDNLEPYLLAIAAQPEGQGNTPQEGTANTDSPQLRVLALKAAQASRWQAYADTASVQMFEENLRYVAKHPPPKSEQRKNPDFLLAFWIADQAPIESWRGSSRLEDLCVHWAALDEPVLDAACARIANLFKSYQPDLRYYRMQRDIRLRADYFDPEGLYWWRLYAAYEQLEKCLEPRWMSEVSTWPAMDISVFELFLKSQVHSGRWQAMRLAAMNEYSTAPGRYSLDPARCELILEQDSASVGTFLGDEDPKGDWVQQQNLILEEQEEREKPFVLASPDELRAMVNQLDQVDSVYDPVVAAIGEQGMSAMPLLLDKFCAEKYLTSLAAAWAAGAIDAEQAIPSLLEAWAKAQAEQQPCENPTALQIQMERNKFRHRPPGTDVLDPDVRALLDHKVCDAGAEGLTVNVDSNGRPFKRFVITNGVSNTTEVECAGIPIELRPLDSEAELERFKTHDVYVARMYLELLDLVDSPDVPDMPTFIEQHGSRPLALAYVVAFQGTCGTTELWVKTEAGWEFLTILSYLMV